MHDTQGDVRGAGNRAGVRDYYERPIFLTRPPDEASAVIGRAVMVGVVVAASTALILRLARARVFFDARQ